MFVIREDRFGWPTLTGSVCVFSAVMLGGGTHYSDITLALRLRTMKISKLHIVDRWSVNSPHKEPIKRVDHYCIMNSLPIQQNITTVQLFYREFYNSLCLELGYHTQTLRNMHGDSEISSSKMMRSALKNRALRASISFQYPQADSTGYCAIQGVQNRIT